MPKASASSAANLATTFSCIFRLSRQAAFAACKKANRSNLTSPRGPKASRRKTFDLSNRGQQTARRGNSRAGQFFLKVREKYGRESRQAQTLERAASTSATRIGHNCQFEYGDVGQLNLIFFDLAYCLSRKFHCWRTISRNELPPSEDQRKTNSCVRPVSFSSNTSDIRFSVCG